MDENSDEKREELRGWPFVHAIVLMCLLGGGYVVWKYYKHHELLPDLAGPNAWIFYALGVGVLLVWGVATRFGTKRR